MPPDNVFVQPCKARGSERRRGNDNKYKPREQQSTLLHKVVLENLETFLNEARLRDPNGQGVPDFVEHELRKFLDCGHLAGGFARLKCCDCKHERLVPFSCKSRVCPSRVCPSCAGRRMSETAAHLVDHVIPFVPFRQVVLSLPFKLRYKLAWNHDLTRKVLKVFYRAVSGFYRDRAKDIGVHGAQTGGVTVIQRVGGALNLNPHYHTGLLDGVFTFAEDGTLAFHKLPPPTQEQIAKLVKTIRKRVKILLKKNGITISGEDFELDPLSDEYPVLAGTYSASVENLVALGERSGRTVMRLRKELEEEPVRHKGRWHARYQGFDLHMGVSFKAHERDKLEKLLRYMLRPPLAQSRLTELPDGKIALSLKTEWRDGTTHMVFEPVELIEKLAAAVPRPQVNQTIYHGVLGARAKWRKKVVAFGRPEGWGDDEEAKEETDRDRPDEYKWAELMKRSFDVDVMRCEQCGGRMELISMIEDPAVIHKILTHLKLPAEKPTPLPARAPPGAEQKEFEF